MTAFAKCVVCRTGLQSFSGDKLLRFSQMFRALACENVRRWCYAGRYRNCAVVRRVPLGASPSDILSRSRKKCGLRGEYMSGIPASPAHPRLEATPFRLFQAINAFHLTEAIRSAIELDIFTAIGAGNTTAEAVASHCGVAKRGARILCDFLVVNGFLSKSGNQYASSEDSATFLDRKSPAYMGSCTEFLLTDDIRQNLRDLTNAVRHGGCRQTYAHAPESPVWVAFARSMAPMMMMASQGLAEIVTGGEKRPLKVLDVAAGHGLFGIAVLRANPKTEVTAVDWKNVLEVARENAEKFGVADRYKTLAGSIFDV